MPTIKDFSTPLLIPYYPNKSGVYALTNKKGKVLYIGSSKQLCRRASHLTALQKDQSNESGVSHLKAKKLRKAQKDEDIFIRFFPSTKFLFIERTLIAKYSPPWNKKRKLR
jgi:excinuclease UvrABC nuclease subunit